MGGRDRGGRKLNGRDRLRGGRVDAAERLPEQQCEGGEGNQPRRPFCCHLGVAPALLVPHAITALVGSAILHRKALLIVPHSLQDLLCSTGPQPWPDTSLCSPHFLASQAGLRMLEEGGNAVDAAIAANAVLNVVYPILCGTGGDLFMLIYDAAAGEVAGLDACGAAGSRATLDWFRAAGHETIPLHGRWRCRCPASSTAGRWQPAASAASGWPARCSRQSATPRTASA